MNRDAHLGAYLSGAVQERVERIDDPAADAVLDGDEAAVNLARLSTRPLRVSLVNSGHPAGRGVAYGTRRPEHLLNVVARNMSALAERVARWAVDYSQREVRQWLQSEHGLRWSNDRLRRVLRAFRRTAVTFRAEAQQQRLLHWLGQAERSRGRHRPVLAIGRDGVMVPIRGEGYQEASAATASVYDRRGRRLGTVYLGQMPQAQQAALTESLTALVTAVLREWSGPLPRLVYVTDKGRAQDDYYRRVLRRLRHPRRPGQRLGWEWVLDFFHARPCSGPGATAGTSGCGTGCGTATRGWPRSCARPCSITTAARSARRRGGRSGRPTATCGGTAAGWPMPGIAGWVCRWAVG